MILDLPTFHEVKKLSVSLNSKYKIRSCPNGVDGVQQSLKQRLEQHLIIFIQKAKKEGASVASTLRIKLTGDGTSTVDHSSTARLASH